MNGWFRSDPSFVIEPMLAGDLILRRACRACLRRRHTPCFRGVEIQARLLHIAGSDILIEAIKAMQAHSEDRLKKSQGKKKLTYIAAIGTLAIIGLAVGYALKRSADDRAAAELHFETKCSWPDTKLSKALSDLEAQDYQVKNLEGAVASARTEGERATAQKALRAAQEEQRRKASVVGQIKNAAPINATGP